MKSSKIFILAMVVSAISLGRVAVAYDPYEAGLGVKFLFFASLGIFVISLGGLSVNLFKKLKKNLKKPQS